MRQIIVFSTHEKREVTTMARNMVKIIEETDIPRGYSITYNEINALAMRYQKNRGKTLRLTEKEIEFIIKYRKLNEYEQGRVIGVLDFLISAPGPRWRLVEGGGKK